MSHFFSNIKYWFSELSEGFQILIFGITLFIVSEFLSGCFDKTYVKMYPNETSSSVATREFKRICGGGSAEYVDDGVEYKAFFDTKREAIHSFMLLTQSLDNHYANGKFRHYYLSQKERIYRCCDRSKKIIAVRYKKYNASSFGDWKPLYSIQFYVEQ